MAMGRFAEVLRDNGIPAMLGPVAESLELSRGLTSEMVVERFRSESHLLFSDSHPPAFHEIA